MKRYTDMKKTELINEIHRLQGALIDLQSENEDVIKLHNIADKRLFKCQEQNKKAYAICNRLSTELFIAY